MVSQNRYDTKEPEDDEIERVEETTPEDNVAEDGEVVEDVEVEEDGDEDRFLEY